MKILYCSILFLFLSGSVIAQDRHKNNNSYYGYPWYYNGYGYNTGYSFDYNTGKGIISYPNGSNFSFRAGYQPFYGGYNNYPSYNMYNQYNYGSNVYNNW